VNKIIFLGLDSGGLEVCANALKHVFSHSSRSKIIFKGFDSGGLQTLKKNFLTVAWKCIKTRF
jgi:hypothetical protein